MTSMDGNIVMMSPGTWTGPTTCTGSGGASSLTPLVASCISRWMTGGRGEL